MYNPLLDMRLIESDDDIIDWGGAYALSPSNQNLNLRLLFARRDSILGSVGVPHEHDILAQHGFVAPPEKIVRHKQLILEERWIPTFPVITFVKVPLYILNLVGSDDLI